MRASANWLNRNGADHIVFPLPLHAKEIPISRRHRDHSEGCMVFQDLMEADLNPYGGCRVLKSTHLTFLSYKSRHVCTSVQPNVQVFAVKTFFFLNLHAHCGLTCLGRLSGMGKQKTYHKMLNLHEIIRAGTCQIPGRGCGLVQSEMGPTQHHG